MTEIEIIQGCISKNEECQKQLFIMHSENLYAVCTRYLSCKEKAKDALQESFIHIFKYFNTYDSDKSKLLTWMKKICINECLKILKPESLKVEYNNYQNVYAEVTEINAQKIIETEELFKKITELPDPYRIVFNLYVIEGYSHFEIASLLKVKEASSRSILSRAKSILKSYLEKTEIQKSWI